MNNKKKDDEQENVEKRVLGDQWLDWDGGDAEVEIDEGRGTFLILSSVILAALVISALLFLYLVLPRFELFGSVWAAVITALIIITAIILVLWYLAVAIRIKYQRRYLNICLDRKNRLLFFLLPYVIKLASLLGISGDRLGHSFILVNNSLVTSPDRDGNILVLLPRCLDRDIMKKVKDSCKDYPDVEYYSTSGGSAARKLVAKTSPRAIIAVACERDLLSGIQFVSGEIPVIGIPNRRPEGPCKSTVIEISEFESALEYFHNSD